MGDSRLTEENKFSNKAPHLIKYFYNKNDAELYCATSHKKVKMICPDCECPKDMMISNLYRRGFSCNRCGDGISTPEKFMTNVLFQLGVEFNVRVELWKSNKEYDFYIPSMNMIIEVHGIQHYKQQGRGRSLKEEQENDVLKEQIAKVNGIEHYIVIDARKSEFLYLKEQTEYGLFVHFRLSKIDWDTVFKYCTTSNMVASWNMYDSGESIDNIAKLLKVHAGTVREYLRQGVILGKTTYTRLSYLKTKPPKKANPVTQFDLNGNFIKTYNSAKEASEQTGINYDNIQSSASTQTLSAGKSFWRYGNIDVLDVIPKNNAKTKVLQYDMFGIFIKSYNSISEASKESGAKSSSISAVCSGKGKSSKGFIWRYDNEEEGVNDVGIC